MKFDVSNMNNIKNKIIKKKIYYLNKFLLKQNEKVAYGYKNLKTGDMILVEVRNTNLTLSQQLKNWVYKIVGNDTATLVTSKAGMVQ